MLEPAVTALAPRPHRTSVIEGCAASWTLSRFLRPLLEHARAEARRRIARDLHDGAQQRLVHTILALKLAQQAGDADVARTLFDEALEEAQAAHTELRQLVRGIRPPVLADGLPAGVRGLAERAPVPVDVEVCVGRLPAPAFRYRSQVAANGQRRPTATWTSTDALSALRATWVTQASSLARVRRRPSATA
jgi:signal transduction histidine kinase